VPGARKEGKDSVVTFDRGLHGDFTITRFALRVPALSHAGSFTTSAVEHRRPMLDFIFAGPVFHSGAVPSDF